MNIKHQTIDIFSLSWLALGNAIFLLGWVRLYYALPLLFLLLYVVIKHLRQSDTEVVYISSRKFYSALIICSILMLLCGVGGYVVQSADSYWRNAMFRDLVNYSWPVFDVETQLTKSYYIGFWMLPALVGKLAHSMEFGFFMQWVWISVGFFLLYLQICRWMGKARLSYIFIFYIFSGLKIVECILGFGLDGVSNIWTSVLLNLGLNITPNPFFAPAINMMLYDPFNQTVPLFLGMMWMLNNKKSAILPVIMALLVLYAPLPLVGLFPVFLYWWGRNMIESYRRGKLISFIFSLSNFCALFLLVIMAFYLASNNNESHKGFRNFDIPVWKILIQYSIYIIFEFLVYIIFVYRYTKLRAEIIIAFLCVCAYAWMQLGLHNDFVFRTNMPLIFLLCLATMSLIYNVSVPEKLRQWMVVILLVGGIPVQIHPALRWLSSVCILTHTPTSELNKIQSIVDVNKLYVFTQTSLRNEELPSSFRCRADQERFRTDVGRKDTFFYRHIARSF